MVKCIMYGTRVGTSVRQIYSEMSSSVIYFMSSESLIIATLEANHANLSMIKPLKYSICSAIRNIFSERI